MGVGFHNKWYRSQKEHWLGWIVYQERLALAKGRNLKFIPAKERWRSLNCIPMMFWLAETAGIDSQRLEQARRIATWNLERPRVDNDLKMDGLGKQIAEIDADIWIFTESSEVVWPGERYSGFHSKHIENYVGHTPREVRSSIWAPYQKLKEIETQDPETSVCVQFASPMGALIVYATIIPYNNAGTRYLYRSMQQEFAGLKQWELHRQSIQAHGNLAMMPGTNAFRTIMVSTWTWSLSCRD